MSFGPGRALKNVAYGNRSEPTDSFRRLEDAWQTRSGPLGAVSTSYFSDVDVHDSTAIALQKQPLEP
jgi:hypothetical protein